MYVNDGRGKGKDRNSKGKTLITNVYYSVRTHACVWTFINGTCKRLVLFETGKGK